MFRPTIALIVWLASVSPGAVPTEAAGQSTADREPQPLSAAMEEMRRSPLSASGADVRLFGRQANGVQVAGLLVQHSLWPDLQTPPADSVVWSWPKVLGITTIGALAGHAASWQVFLCGFDERRSCTNDLLLIPMVLAPVAGVTGAGMLAGFDFWESFGGSVLGAAGSALVYVLGFGGKLPSPGFVGLAILTHAGITTAVNLH